MDRTVPQTGTEEIALYIRTYYSLLRSSHAVQLDALVEAHVAMNSSLHANAREPLPDAAALYYAVSRLPLCISSVDLVVMGQTDRVFHEYGYSDVQNWRRVISPARRRRLNFDGQSTLAVYIASRSDIDDLIPTLVAYQSNGTSCTRCCNPCRCRPAWPLWPPIQRWRGRRNWPARWICPPTISAAFRMRGAWI